MNTKADKIVIEKNTANTWSVTVMDDDGDILARVIANSWDAVVDILKLTGCTL